MKPLAFKGEWLAPLLTMLAALVATVLATMLLVFTTATPAKASSSIVVDTSPGTAAPPATLGPYTMTPFEPDSRPLFGVVSDVPAPDGGTLQFDRSMGHYRVEPGVGWGSWSHGYTGDVYSNFFQSSPIRDQVVMKLPANTRAFYFYVEPNLQDIVNVRATATDGTTSGPVAVSGLAGASYFGFYTTCGTALSTITVDVDPKASGFAVGEFGVDDTDDTLALTVCSTTPTENQQKVRRNTNVTATFTADMDPSTLTASTFTLINTKTGETVDADVSYDEATKTVTLDPFPDNPTQKLAKRTTYKAKISGAKDLAANTLPDKEWSFKTGRK